jgi:hypothetical protein
VGECCSGRRLLKPQFRQLTWALWGALESARDTTWSAAVVRDQCPVDVDTHPLEGLEREKGLGEYRSHQSEEPLDERMTFAHSKEDSLASSPQSWAQVTPSSRPASRRSSDRRRELVMGCYLSSSPLALLRRQSPGQINLRAETPFLLPRRRLRPTTTGLHPAERLTAASIGSFHQPGLLDLLPVPWKICLL